MWKTYVTELELVNGRPLQVTHSVTIYFMFTESLLCIQTYGRHWRLRVGGQKGGDSNS